MSTGSTGGVIGARISEKLEQRCGKRRSNLWSGVACFVVGLAFLVGYVVTEPFSASSYQRVTLSPEEVRHRDSRKNEAIMLTRGAVEYEVARSMWRDKYVAHELVGALRRADEVTLWLKPGESNYRTARGLRAGSVYLNPEHGAALDNENRRWLLWLALLFAGFGVWGVGYAMYLRRKGA